MAGMTLAACSSDSSDPGQEVPPPGDPENMVFAAFSGMVKENGSPLAGVTVSSGSQTVTTDMNGAFRLDNVNNVNGRAVIKFEKAGYISVVRSAKADKVTRMDVQMTQAQTTTSFDSQNGTTVNVGYMWSGQVQVDLPADGYMNGTTPYSGTVKVAAAYLDPDNSDFANQMPGDLSAVRTDQSEAQLVSYGMVSVNLTGSNGEQLQLKEGSRAQLTFPIPDKFASQEAPAEIPLWYFDEATGLWVEEGTATLQGDKYVGYVTHFSWHNLDSPELRASLKVTVKNSKGDVLPFVPVDIDGQRLFYTNKDGVMECDVPSNVKLYVRIPSEAYGNYAESDPTLDKKEYMTLSGGESKSITFTLPSAAPVISGTVTNTGSGSNICTVFIVYNGSNQTTPAISDTKGAFKIFAPANYRGKATLVAKFGDANIISQEIEITDDDQTVNLTASNDAASSVAGVFTISNSDGLNAHYVLPEGPNGGLWNATIGTIYDRYSGNESTGLTISGNTMPQNQEVDWDKIGEIVVFSISVPGYTESKTAYDNVSFFYMKEGGPHLSVNATGKATVTKSGDVYTVKMTNVATESYDDQMRGIYFYNSQGEGALPVLNLEIGGKLVQE